MYSVYFTSFKKSIYLPDHVIPYSAAVYQPKGFKYEKINWTDIRRGKDWTRPRDFLGEENPLSAYRKSLMDLYESRLEEAIIWRDSLTSDVALCCWCPYDKAAQRQIEIFGSFVCHTAVLNEFVTKHLWLPTWEDSDRRSMAVLTQI